MRTKNFKRQGIIKRFGQWAVTSFGIETLAGPWYEIDRVALGHAWWLEHMSLKRWVVPPDFEAALDFARKYFGISGVATDVGQDSRTGF